MAGERAYTSYAVDNDPNDADQNIDALLTGDAWDISGTNVVTYSFPDSASDIGYTLSNGWTWANGFNAVQQQAAREAFAMYEAVSGLVFEEIGDDPGEDNANGTIRLFDINNVGTAFGWYPWTSERGGDSHFRDGKYENPERGTFEYHTIMHEIGHNLGLEHGHEGGAAKEMTADKDGMEYSLMTYNSFVGQSEQPGFYTNASGHYAQTPMMYDIAALQRVYGANYDTNSGSNTYTFDLVTGEMKIDGVGQGVPQENVIFRTVWDGGGFDTYDLSNFATNLMIDLTPGGYSDFDVNGNTQKALLNQGWDSIGTFVGASEYEWASGHLYNALLHEGDTRSLIESAKGGLGSDVLMGNSAANVLEGGSGSDTLMGVEGNDLLKGGLGADTLDGGAGFDFADYRDVGTALFIDLQNPLASTQAFREDTLIDIKGLFGTAAQSNTFLGDDGRTFFNGGAQGDLIDGRGGSDILRGLGGDDTIEGGAGNDALLGNSGNDIMSGGADRDIFWFGLGQDDDDVITDFTPGSDLLGFQGDTVDARGDLAFSSDAGTGFALLTWANGSILLEGVSIAEADVETNFLFV